MNKMNQALLFNDDLSFDEQRHAWIFSCLIEGDKHTVIVEEQYHSRAIDVDQTTKFDWEAKVEDWLQKFEPVGLEIILELND